MRYYPSGSRPSKKAPADNFTGAVWQDPIIMDAVSPARVRAISVHFEPGARTNWHTHVLGQTLYVVSGCGRFQSAGGKPIEIRPGDTLWIPPGEKHWHGAAPTTSMTHIAIQETLDGISADWIEPVSDADYNS